MKIHKRIYLKAYKHLANDGIERHFQTQVSEFGADNSLIFEEVELAFVDVEFDVSDEQYAKLELQQLGEVA